MRLLSQIKATKLKMKTKNTAKLWLLMILRNLVG